jgi:hypothetical protein
MQQLLAAMMAVNLYHHHHVTQSSHSINAIGPAPLWSGKPVSASGMGLFTSCHPVGPSQVSKPFKGIRADCNLATTICIPMLGTMLGRTRTPVQAVTRSVFNAETPPWYLVSELHGMCPCAQQCMQTQTPQATTACVSDKARCSTAMHRKNC